jgi:hypothetical protein
MCVGVWGCAGVRVCVGGGRHKNINAPLILEVWKVFLFALGKPHNGALLGIFF